MCIILGATAHTFTTPKLFSLGSPGMVVLQQGQYIKQRIKQAECVAVLTKGDPTFNSSKLPQWTMPRAIATSETSEPVMENFFKPVT